MNYAKLARTVAMLGLLYLLVVGLCDAGLNAQESQSLGAVGVSISGQKGVTITRLLPGGLAQRMGLQVGDRITAMNGRHVKQAAEAELMFSIGLREDLRVAYVRGEKK